jgi:hypothetical protein
MIGGADPGYSAIQETLKRNPQWGYKEGDMMPSKQQMVGKGQYRDSYKALKRLEGEMEKATGPGLAGRSDDDAVAGMFGYLKDKYGKGYNPQRQKISDIQDMTTDQWHGGWSRSWEQAVPFEGDAPSLENVKKKHKDYDEFRKGPGLIWMRKRKKEEDLVS